MAKAASAATRSSAKAIGKAVDQCKEAMHAVSAVDSKAARLRQQKMAAIPTELEKLASVIHGAAHAIQMTADLPFCPITVQRRDAMAAAASQHLAISPTLLDDLTNLGVQLTVAQLGPRKVHDNSLPELNEDCLHSLLDLVGLAGVPRIRAVCQQWNSAATSKMRNWRSFTVTTSFAQQPTLAVPASYRDEMDETGDAGYAANDGYTRSVFVLPGGDVAVASYGFNQLEIFTPDGSTRLRTVGGVDSEIGVIRARGMACDGEALFIADCEHNRILKIGATPPHQMLGSQTLAGQPGGALTEPHDVAVIANSVFVVDRGNWRVVELDRYTLTLVSSFGHKSRYKRGEGRFASGAKELVGPTGLATDGNLLYLSEYEKRWVIWKSFPGNTITKDTESY